MDSHWSDRLRELLTPGMNVAVMGIGNEMMGDDAAGVLVVRELQKLMPRALPGGRVYLFECSTTPENFTGSIEKLGPGVVLLIDSADMGAAVGEARLLDTAAMGSMMHSTHTMPLSFLADYIGKTSGAHVIALGIQAGHILLDRPVSPEVLRTVRQVALSLSALLTGQQTLCH
jgi:hydrogenase 3 maturation protease